MLRLFFPNFSVASFLIYLIFFCSVVVLPPQSDYIFRSFFEPVFETIFSKPIMWINKSDLRFPHEHSIATEKGITCFDCYSIDYGSLYKMLTLPVLLGSRTQIVYWHFVLKHPLCIHFASLYDEHRPHSHCNVVAGSALE